MSEVLENPAFSPEHDSKLREQLRNAGEAGVKIAGAAAATSFLKQAAAKGALTQETVEAFKVKTKTASDQTASTTIAQDTSKDAAVAKLRTAMDAQRKHKESMGGMSGDGVHGGSLFEDHNMASACGLWNNEVRNHPFHVRKSCQAT
jgi:hypothetical protein